MSTAYWSDGAAGPLLASLAAEQASLAWQDLALCAQTDPDAFFPEKGGSARQAKRVCRRCDVRAECLQYALEHDERFGIWGGKSERERRRLKARADVRPCGHPRTEENTYRGGDGKARCRECLRDKERRRPRRVRKAA